MSKTPTTPTAKMALKATTLDGGSPVHAHGWDLPTQGVDGTWTAGKWSRVAGLVRYRGNGLHICQVDQLAYWYGHLRGRKMVTWVCEYTGHTDIGAHGFAARRVRLLRPWTGETLD